MKGPRQPDPGTRPSCYRCSLPGLTGFTTGRRGGTDADSRTLPVSPGARMSRRRARPELPATSRQSHRSGWPGRDHCATMRPSGEVAERSKALAWKASVR